MKIIVSRIELLAALVFSSGDEDRFTLASVCVEVGPERKPTLIATDGRRLCVIESQAEQAEEFEAPRQLLLRADFLRPICALSRSFGGKLFPWIQFENNEGSTRCGVTFIGGDAFFEAEKNALVEGTFPNWRQCVPAKNAVRTQINDLGITAEFFGDFSRAMKILNSPTGMIQMNLVGEDSAIEVKIPGVEYFYALVMPCKVDKTVDYQPEFLGIVENLPVREKESKAKPEKPEGELPPGTVTIKTGGKSVTVTTAQFSAAAKKLSKAAKSDCDEDEELIQQCIEVIRAEQMASISLLQRRLRLGYTRTARIMDELEHRGIVGPSKGSEPRDILMEATA